MWGAGNFAEAQQTSNINPQINYTTQGLPSPALQLGKALGKPVIYSHPFVSDGNHHGILFFFLMEKKVNHPARP